MTPRKNEPTAQRQLQRVNDFLRDHPEIRPGGLRDQIFKAKQNGLHEARAIVRHVSPGCKRGVVYVDVEAYFSWLRGETRSAA